MFHCEVCGHIFLTYNDYNGILISILWLTTVYRVVLTSQINYRTL